MGIGIIVGLVAATFQDCGYILSRLYVKKNDNSWSLLVLTQLIMGIASLVILPIFWVPGFWQGWQFLLPLLGVSAGSLGGQYCFFNSEKTIEPARISSLMGLRVILLAIISASAGLEQYNFWQVCGILLAAISAVVMNYQDGKFQFAGTGWLSAALLCYCLSDISVKFMIDHIHAGNLYRSSLLAACLVNLLLGVITLPWSCKLLHLKEILPAVPFAGSWLVKQFFLYTCYAMIGPVFGNVVLAMRGPIAILLSLVLLYFGVHQLGLHVSLGTWLRRSIATLMMFAAIILYSYAML